MKFNATREEVERLAEKAEAEIRSRDVCKNYSDLLPAVAPFIETGNPSRFSEAAQFLAKNGVIPEDSREAAAKGSQASNQRQ